KGTFMDKTWLFLKDYLSLTKPRIIVLLTITGIGGFFVPQPNLNGVSFLDLLVFVFVGYASAGGAMTINNFIDRDIDALMDRTKDRPSVTEDGLAPKNVLIFGILLTTVGIVTAYFYFSSITALFLSWGALFYLFGYSLFLKRKSILNTVLGGLASPAPVWVGYAARLNASQLSDIPIEGWLLGAIVFIWTPSHTWALSTKHLADYEAAGIPMLPVKLGMVKTGQITFIAGLITILYGTWFAYYVESSPLVIVALIIPNFILFYGLWVFYRKPSTETANTCFKAHNAWMAIIFSTIVLFLWI
ncbi:MAG: heme o synthase, partial [Candidatus Heimdallarchaeota archaeon]